MTETDLPIRQQLIARQLASSVPHLAALGIVFHDNGPDWAELHMPFADQQIADPDYGIIASGAIFTLLDSAAGVAVQVSLAAMLPIATIDLRIDYLRGPLPGSTIIGRAHCYRLTHSIAFVRGIAHDGDADNPVANMTGTFMINRPTPGDGSRQ